MKLLKCSVLLFFLAYWALQALGKNLSPRFEYFPVFSWSLFTSVRNDVTSVAIEVTRVGKVEYDPARNYYQIPELSSHAARRTSSPFKAAWRLLGTPKTPEELEQLLNEFNAAYFDTPSEVAYQIVVENFDPLEKWKTGQVKSRSVILGNLLKEAE